MFFFKTIRELKYTVKTLEKRLKVLECPHKSTVFVINTWHMYAKRIEGWEKCTVCGKTLRNFEKESDMLKAKNEKLMEGIEDNKRKLEKLK